MKCDRNKVHIRKTDRGTPDLRFKRSLWRHRHIPREGYVGRLIVRKIRLTQAHQSMINMCSVPVYICMGFDQNSFIRERPFFANKKFTFAKLSRTPCISFAGPMLANKTSYEDSYTTCQITPENHGSLLGSLLNMQLASRNPFQDNFFCKVYWPTPFNMHFDFHPLFRITFAKISLFKNPGHQQGVH